MTTQTHVHVLSHTHWDREWYLPYEKHHLKLIRLMDSVLELLDRDPEFKSFHLDGQTIIIEDYLQVRPDMRGKVEKYVREGRLINGPWYILQDEFLTSSEANVRNLLIGHQDAAAFGPVAKIGYFPDSFGNMGQAPQMMRQAGIEAALFGRGVKPTGANNVVTDGDFESPYSEMEWESPDGSKVLGILFANWYHNGMEIPVDPEESRVYWEQRMQDAAKYASTPHLLFMNGCDHQPVQANLTEALQVAKQQFPDVEFIHTNFPDYIRTVQGAVSPDLKIIRGELRSQRTDGWGTLVNTASARVYIKQANQACQALLEKVAEPLAVLASNVGVPYPHDLFTYNWKMLMQNHPHDSICGCSVDEVHQEMMTRFSKSRHLTEGLIEESTASITGEINTDIFNHAEAVPFVVFNTAGVERSGLIRIDLDLERVPLYEPSPAEIAQGLASHSIEGKIVNHEGQLVPAVFEDLGVGFGYTLPSDKFRQPYMARRVRVAIQAEHVPAGGYATYAFIPGPASEAAAADHQDSLRSEGNTVAFDNDKLGVIIASNGTFTVMDKATGKLYRDLGSFEDTGDIGNEYMYKQPAGEQARTTAHLQADIQVLEQSYLRTVVAIELDWEIPAHAESALTVEQQQMVHFPDRKSQRTSTTVPLKLHTVLTLERGADVLGIRVSYNNQAADHRLRMLFPTDLQSDVHVADSIFELAERDNVPAVEWNNPSNCQHVQTFVAVDEQAAGLAVANLGLNEYEVMRDGRNTIAVTLLRSVGELGDWGVFLTPEAQCIGEQTAELQLIPYRGRGNRHDAAVKAALFHTPWTAVQTTVHSGSLPAVHRPLQWGGSELILSAVKLHASTGDQIIRWYNTSNKPAQLTIHADAAKQAWYKSNILEENLLPLIPADGLLTITVGPAEIITLGCRRAD
ncbi:alpha-mannosidase [Paenibacillus sp. GCM10023252]|uniref:alpha-mannosidase n=1 Tax=Paenibacillus sp. GCM10023252 TaxID=3252649 RepID=UPI003608E2D5